MFSYAAASRLSFHYLRNTGWSISFNKGTTYALKMLIIILFLSLNYSVFYVEAIVLIHVMTMSGLSVSSALIMSFTSDVNFSKFLLLKSKRMNPFEKYYPNILLEHLSMTTQSLFSKKP